MKRPSIIEEIEKEEDGSRVGWLPGGWGAIGAVPRPVNQLSKRHQSTRTRTKIRDRGQLRRTRFQRGGIGHGSNAFFPYSCFNPSRSRGKMLIFFEARGSSFSFEILGIGWKRKLVDLSSSWNWRYDRADPGIAAPILAPYHICIRVRRGRLSINSRWGFFWVPERFEFFPFLFCLFSLFFSLLGQESERWCRRLWSMVIMSLGIFHGSMIDSFEEFFSFFNGQK